MISPFMVGHHLFIVFEIGQKQSIQYAVYQYITILVQLLVHIYQVLKTKFSRRYATF
jgi:hypothetical protein